jgi:thioredoxin reductase (NADPH)
VVERINGENRVESIEVHNVRTDEKKILSCDGVFIFIGHVPNTHFLCNLFPVDCGGQVETDRDMMTSAPGIFAIGDVRKHSYRQIATAVGEGATAAIAGEHWIEERGLGTAKSRP